MADALWKLEAGETAAKIAAKEISAGDVIEAHLARLDAVNPALNAITRPLHDSARAAAREADAAVARGDALGPLHGVPVTIKDNVALYDGVTIEDDVFIGPNAVFTNVVRPRAFLSQKDNFAATVIRTGSTIGANATIICGVEIGAYAMIGAGSVVSRDVPAHALVVGNPARQTGWVSRAGATLSADGICATTGERYIVNQDGVRPENRETP